MSDIVNNNADICVEAHYGRKRKENINMSTKFKGVIRGVLISTLIVTSVLGTTMPAFAANDETFRNETNEIVRTYGVSFEEAMSSVTNAINTINTFKANGTVTQAQLETLANSIMDLERATDKTDFSAVSAVATVLDKAESAIDGVKGNETVIAAIAASRVNLGIEKTTINVQQAKAELKSFSDVPSTAWYYNDVMFAAQNGLIQGTSTPDANGVGTFAPDKTMSRAEFITVALRAAKIDKTAYNAGHWYDGNWDAAVRWGIIKKTDFGGLEGMTQGCSRAEMAYILINTLEYMGEKPTRLVDTSRIADYDTINTTYRNYVLKAYSMGLLMGTDSKGTFRPDQTLPRCQAAAVLTRLIDAGRRGTPNFDPVQPEVSSAALTIHEGEVHYRALKAGDTVIKADGTKVVLTETNVHGIKIVGLGQGVDVYSGYTDNGITLNMNDGKKHGAGELYNGGDATTLTKLWNGEVRSTTETNYILKYRDELGFSKPTTPGTYDGEHRNTFWVWRTSSMFEENYTPQWEWDC